LVIDASADNTADIVEKWQTRDNRVKLIKQQGRNGKRDGIITGLDHVSPDCEIIVLTDADALWEPEALTKAVAYLSDPTVGCVTARINYARENRESSEHNYRDWFNSLRLAESKIHSTPIHNGPFFAVRWELFREIPLQRFEGIDDSMFGSFIAFTGFRAIQANDIAVEEPMRGAVLRRKVRRAQTLLFNFALTPRFVRSTGLYRKTSFEKIWYAEWWLHIVNPWLLVIGCVMTLLEAGKGSVLGLWLLTAGLVSLLFKTPRMWFLQQLYLAIGAVKSLIKKRIVWEEREVDQADRQGGFLLGFMLKLLGERGTLLLRHS
jgi:biofilm PGA synthesis N-glycosyltransferase PgaC